MADLTLTYGDRVITTLDGAGKVILKTCGKYCAKDIAVEYVGGGDSGSITKSYTAPQSSNIDNGNAVVILERGIELLTKPTCQTPEAGIAGQNQEQAINALNATGANTENVANWATSNYKYNNLWIGADFGNPIALNSVVVGCRTWDGRRQIYTIIFEASNDAADWTELGTSRVTGNNFPATGWYLFGTGNTAAYRYYRVRTQTSGSGINGSVTFTINGLGFLNYQTALPFGTPYEVYYKNDDTLYIFNS